MFVATGTSVGTFNGTFNITSTAIRFFITFQAHSYIGTFVISGSQMTYFETVPTREEVNALNAASTAFLRNTPCFFNNIANSSGIKMTLTMSGTGSARGSLFIVGSRGDAKGTLTLISWNCSYGNAPTNIVVKELSDNPLITSNVIAETNCLKLPMSHYQTVMIIPCINNASVTFEGYAD